MKARLSPVAALALGTLLLLAGLQPSFAQAPSKVSQAVKDRVAERGRARVIVQLAGPSAVRQAGPRSAEQRRQQRSEIAEQHRRLRATLRGRGHQLVHEFADAPYAALVIDAGSLAELESPQSPALRVFEDRLFAPILADSVPLIEADLAHEAGLTGTGNVVAVIDSGVDSSHPFLAGKVIEEACYASPDSGSGGDCPNGQATQTGPGAAVNCSFAPQACRHGTHVAGIAVGAGATFSGVAPGADLIAIQVFHASTADCLIPFEEFPCPRAFESDIVAGLERVLALADQHNIAAVNLSLGGTAYDSACDLESPLFAAAIDNLKSVGIATVAASGNDGLSIGIAEPACIASAISVGASTEDDQVAWFSNVSADLDLLAPGTGVTSSVPGGSFDSLDGTSMAAPHVTGAWAVYKQANPTATVDEALASFLNTGVPISDWRGGPTKPRIKVGAAVGIESPAPSIDSVSPTSVVAYGPAFTLTVNGSGFVRSSKVQVNGSNQATTYVSDAQLTASVAASLIATPDSTLTITVFTSPPGGGTSNAVDIQVVTPVITLTPDATTATPGTPVTVTLEGGPGGASDMMTFAEVGSGATSYVHLTYVGAGVSNRTWTVDMPASVGQYEFRFFLNNDFNLQFGASPTVTVEAEPGPEPGSATLTPDTTTATPGAPVTVTLEGGPGGATDVMTLAKVGSAAASYEALTYVGNGVTDRTWTVNMPTDLDQYEFRLFLNNDFNQQFAVSAAITVESAPGPEPGSATLTPDTTTATPGAPVTVTLEGGPGGATDMMTLAKVGSAAASYEALTYVGNGVTDRTWTVNMPTDLDQYEFRLFLNNDFNQQFAVSAAVTVEAESQPPTATLTPSVTSATPGTPVTVTLAGGPGEASNVMTLARVGSAGSSYAALTYVGNGVTDRTWTVNMPANLDDYEFRLFSSNTFNQQLAVSAAVTVEAEPGPEPGSATLTPSTTIATPGTAVTVTLAGGPGGATDMMTLARVGSSNSSYEALTYVGNGITDRTWTVNMPATLDQYEFRLFLSNDFNQQFAVSAPVTVEAEPGPEPGSATLTPDTTSATPGAPVTVTLEGGPGGATDMMTLARVGSSSSSYVSLTYVGSGVADRTWTVNMPSALDQYEFRLFLNNDFNQQFAVSAAITVEAAPDPAEATLTPDVTTATPGVAVTVTLAGGLGGASDIMTLAKVGSAAASYVALTYVGNGVTDRTWTVNMPTDLDQYEFRLFLSNDFNQPFGVSPAVTVEAEPGPEPGSATLTPDTTTATPGSAVTVTLAGSPGGATDMMTLAKVGSAASSYVAFTYVGNGVTDRTWTVNMPANLDDYEFRLFLNNDFNQQFAVSVAITVEAEPGPEPGSTTLTPDTTSASPGTPVTVTLAGGPGGATDMMTLAKVGSPAHRYVALTYVGNGVTDRTWTVNMPTRLGQYEFRLFGNNNFNNQVAVSSPVSVE